MRRVPLPAPLFLALLLAASSAAGQARLPPGSAGMVERDGQVVHRDLFTGRVDTTRYVIYADSSFAVFSFTGDTTYVSFTAAMDVFFAVNKLLGQAGVDQPFLSLRVVDGRVSLHAGRDVPLWAAALVAVLGLGGVVGLFIFLARRLRQERQQREQLQAAGRRLAEGREDERRRLARELHDSPLQTLHALHMQLGVVTEALAAGDGAAATAPGRLRGAQDEVHTAIGELRAIVETLRPPSLGLFGLAAALRAYGDRFRRQHPDVALGLTLDDDGERLPEPVRLALFRIAQEAMGNAAKHGRPDRVGVVLRLGLREAELMVVDDGLGLPGALDVGALATTGHYGLLGMEERAGAVGGRLDVESRPEGGVRVRVVVPLPAA